MHCTISDPSPASAEPTTLQAAAPPPDRQVHPPGMDAATLHDIPPGQGISQDGTTLDAVQPHDRNGHVLPWYSDTTIPAIMAHSPDDAAILQQWAADEQLALGILLPEELRDLVRHDSACQWFSRYLDFYSLVSLKCVAGTDGGKYTRAVPRNQAFLAVDGLEVPPLTSTTLWLDTALRRAYTATYR